MNVILNSDTCCTVHTCWSLEFTNITCSTFLTTTTHTRVICDQLVDSSAKVTICFHTVLSMSQNPSHCRTVRGSTSSTSDCVVEQKNMKNDLALSLRKTFELLIQSSSLGREARVVVINSQLIQGSCNLIARSLMRHIRE